MLRTRHLLFLTIAVTAYPFVARAQDTATTKLAPVVIEVGRGQHRSPLELPYAVTVQTPDSSRPGQRHLSLDETLLLVPGLTVSNRTNPSQDPRISIRGFGARSAFGVRGIRVLRDGIPLTLPDGQTPVDYLDLESVGRVEVMRGSASSLYGNAGGGVIDVRTSEPVDAPLFATIRGWSGAYGSRRLAGKAEGITGPVSYQGDVAHTDADGYRDYSRLQTTNGFGRLSYEKASTSYSLEWMGVNTPVAQNPGALTRAQFDADPRQADQAQITKRARKAVTQSQLGGTALYNGARGEVEATAYAGTRTLDNPLTFAIVDVGRTLSGGNVRASVPLPLLVTEHRFTIGAEVQRQNDLRRNFTNCNSVPAQTVPTGTCPAVGEERGDVTLDQWEIVSSFGAYARDEIKLRQRVTASAGIRSDAIRFEVKDHLISATNPDDSGRRLLHAVSPMFGLLASLSPSQAAYANVSTAFETPTATELGNSPAGTGGINRELQPQRSLTYEVGFKGFSANGAQYNAALFATSVHDELIPYDIPASGGRRYFRNAGRTSRRGLELNTSYPLGPVMLSGAYSYANFRFRDFTVGTSDYAGNRIPGIPRQTFQAAASARTLLGTIVGEANIADRMFVDDANSQSSPGYAIFNLRLDRQIMLGRSGAEFTFGAQNIFNTPWVSSVSVNAAGGKFYEPGPQRALFVGLSILGSTARLR